jgi:hypothetical protein
MRQRPSLFNYATAGLAANPKLWCARVAHTADVTNRGNPLFTILDPLPLLGADAPPVGIGFCAQLVEAEIDFHPGNTVALPAELSPPLPEQRFSLLFRVCGALECPSLKLVDGIHVSAGGGVAGREGKQPPGPPIVLPGITHCFCLDVFAVGDISRELVAGHESLVATVDEMDIVDIKPDALEANLICYLMTAANVVLREKLTFAIETLMFKIPLFGMGSITLFPTPNPPLPHNPAVEDDQVKVFVTMTV